MKFPSLKIQPEFALFKRRQQISLCDVFKELYLVDDERNSVLLSKQYTSLIITNSYHLSKKILNHQALTKPFCVDLNELKISVYKMKRLNHPFFARGGRPLYHTLLF